MKTKWYRISTVPVLLTSMILGVTGCIADPEVAPERSSSLSPRVTRIVPEMPRPGEPITIEGTGFGELRDGGWVRIAAQPFNDRPIISSWSDTEIVARLDRHLTGKVSLSVMTAPAISSPAVVLSLAPACPPVPEFTRFFTLTDAADTGVADSEALDVASTDGCQIAVAGFSARKEKNGLLLVTDAHGEPMDGFPVHYRDVREWRSITNLPYGFALVGTGSSDEVVIAEVDRRGRYRRGWPRMYESGKEDWVTDAVRTPTQFAVVGTRGATGFFALFDLAGELVADHTFEHEAGGVRHPKGLTATTNGFVVVGERIRPLAAGGATESWLAEMQVTGTPLIEKYRPSVAHLSAVAASRDQRLLAVGSNEVGKTVLVSMPGVLDSFQYDTDSAQSLLGVDALDFGYVAVGYGRSDAVLIRTDCVGRPMHEVPIKLGADARLEAVMTIYDSPASVEERAFLSVGSRRHKGRRQAVLIRRDAFPISRPVVTFEVGGGPDVQVGYGDPITLSYKIADAWRYTIRKVAGPGPEPPESGAVVHGSPVESSHVLTFATPALEACAANGCAATVYEVVAIGVPPVGRCMDGMVTRATVSLFFDLDAKWQQLVQSSAVVMEKYGTFETAFPPVGVSHVDFYASTGPKNRCLDQLGLPYGTVDAIGHALPPIPGSVALVDDRAPGLVSYHSDALGNPTTLAMIGLGAWFTQQRPALLGEDYVEAEQWKGHWGGWHTGEGGMTVVTPTAPGFPYVLDWRMPLPTPPLLCGDRIQRCGALPPWLWHPALWDIHIFYPLDGSLPRIAFTSGEADLANPCAAIPPSSPVPPLVACDTGIPSLGISPFFDVAEDGSPVPLPCE